jgi:hypothetical protein
VNSEIDPTLPARVNALGPIAQAVARLIAACRAPLGLGDVKGIAARTDAAGRLTDRDLSEALSALEAGALIVDSHDGSARYEMPDAVREEVRARLAPHLLTTLIHAAYGHFVVDGLTEGPEDLPRAVHVFHLLIERGEDLAACRLYRLYIHKPLLLRDREACRCAAMLERLLSEGRETRLLLASPRELSMALNALGLAYQLGDRPAQSLAPLERARMIDDRTGEVEDRVITLRNLARGMLDCGRLRDAEHALNAAASLAASDGLDAQKRFLLVETWGARALRGLLEPGLLQEAMSLCQAVDDFRVEGVVWGCHAQRRLWLARAVLDEANGMPEADWNRAKRFNDARDLTRSAGDDLQLAEKLAEDRMAAAESEALRRRRLRGIAALLRGEPGDLPSAEADLSYVAKQAAKARELAEEIPALLALVEIGLRSGQSEAAATHLEVARSRLAGSGYRLFEADCQVWISRWEQVAGRLTRAVEAAARAYELSWCDGPPFVYHWGLVAARRQLSALAAAEPQVVEPSLGTYGARRGT